MRVSSSILMTSTDFFRFAKDIYCKRFPDLETLIVQPLDYLLTAKELGNNIGNTKNNKTLEAYLSQATIMVVSVTASTTTGAGTLNEKDLEIVSNGTRIFQSNESLTVQRKKIFEVDSFSMIVAQRK